jgi:hypothetical protein
MRRGRAVGVIMAVFVMVVVVGGEWNHAEMLYYNITSVYQRAVWLGSIPADKNEKIASQVAALSAFVIPGRCAAPNSGAQSRT